MKNTWSNFTLSLMVGPPGMLLMLLMMMMMKIAIQFYEQFGLYL